MSKTLTKLFILAISFIFLASYLIASSGYYEYTMQQRTIITNEKIKEFEEDIKNMPMGLHTVLSEGCGTISGGQKQRILIARAIVDNPKIIYFPYK